jgi:hypothetical protein
MPAVAFVVFDGFYSMALAAQSVFEFTNRALREPFYQTLNVSEAGGPGARFEWSYGPDRGNRRLRIRHCHLCRK